MNAFSCYRSVTSEIPTYQDTSIPIDIWQQLGCAFQNERRQAETLSLKDFVKIEISQEMSKETSL